MLESNSAILSADNQRLSEINLVIQEKEAMVRVGRELLELIGTDWNHRIDELAFGKKKLEFIQHLTNIAGFCDKSTKSAISLVVEQFTVLVVGRKAFENATKNIVKFQIPMAIGIQVDFTKRPFRVFGLDVGAFGARVKALVKR